LGAEQKDFCIELLESLDKLSSNNNKARDVSAEIISCRSLVAVFLVLFILKNSGKKYSVFLFNEPSV